MNDRSPAPGKLAQRPGGMKLYAWIVTTSTLLLVGLLLWPMSVNTFRSTARFQVSYRPDSGLEKSSISRKVVAALRDQTSPANINDLLQHLDTRITSPLLTSADVERLREAISIRGRLGDSANSVDYQIVLQGSGSADEIEFLNTLVIRVNAALDAQLNESNAREVIDRLTGQFTRWHAEVVQQMAGQVDDVLNSLETARNDIQIITNDLTGYQQVQAGSGSRSPLGRADRNDDASQLQLLKSEKERLLSQPGMTPFHAEVTAVQEQIERLQNSGTTSSGGGGSFQVPGNSQGKIIQNQFAPGIQSGQRRESPTFDSSLTRIVDGIRMVNLEVPGRKLSELRTQIGESHSNAETLAGRMGQAARNDLDVVSPLTLTDFQRAASSAPVGGVPTGQNFLWLGIFAGLIGAAVAMNFDPSLKKRKFRSLAQMQNKLGLPVVGMVRSIQTIRQPRSIRRQTATSMVKFCEWTLLGIGVLLVVAALLNSQVAGAFLENPFHGITRTVWMLTAHG